MMATTLARQAELLELAHDAIIVLDGNGVIALWNRGARNPYGWPKESAVGCVAHELLGIDFPVPYEEIQ